MRPRSSSQPRGTPFDAGVRLLARRAHSRAELRQKLLRKGFDGPGVLAALERLAGLGYLDDAAFARGLVRRRGGSRGPRALAAELGAKGIDREGVDAALADFDAGAQLEAAIRLAERLYAPAASGDGREAINRLGAKLIRRGFGVDVARAACRAVVAGAPAPRRA